MARTAPFLLSLAALSGSAAASAAAGAAQLPASDQRAAQETILVTGSRPAREAVRSFVEAVTVETEDQIARFETPLCPIAVGLPPGHGEVITTRLRQIARHLGIGAVDDPHCHPNVVVVVADSGGDFVHAIRRTRPRLFGMLEVSQIREFLRLEGPVRAWHFFEPRGSDGRPMQRITFLAGQPPRFIPHGYQLTGVMPSRTHTPTRQDITTSLVVFDVEALEGLTLLQIADHAAMRALARTEPAAMPSGRSILGLFEERDAGAPSAASMTDWDGAYLAAVYRTMSNVRANQHRSTIARTMLRELEIPPQQPRP